MININVSREIIIAAVSNPSFFSQSATSDGKIKQVCDLIESVTKTIEPK